MTSTSYTPASATFTPGHTYWWQVSARAGLWSTGTASAAARFQPPGRHAPRRRLADQRGRREHDLADAHPGRRSPGAAYYERHALRPGQAPRPRSSLRSGRSTGRRSPRRPPCCLGHLPTPGRSRRTSAQGRVGYFGPPSRASVLVRRHSARPAPGLVAPSAGSSDLEHRARRSSGTPVPGRPSATPAAKHVTDLTAGAPAFTVSGLTTTSYATIAPLVAGHKYQWTVTATDADGDSGISANPTGLSVVVPPPVVAPPTPASPSGTVASAQPSLRWSTVAGASGYGVEIVDTTPGARSSAFPLATVDGTSYTPGSPLQAGHTYTWEVIAYGAAGNASTWSAPLTFTIKDEATDDFDGVRPDRATAVSTPKRGLPDGVVNPVTGAPSIPSTTAPRACRRSPPPATTTGSAGPRSPPTSPPPAPARSGTRSRARPAPLPSAARGWCRSRAITTGSAGPSRPSTRSRRPPGRSSTRSTGTSGASPGASRTTGTSRPPATTTGRRPDRDGRDSIPSTATWMIWNPITGGVRTRRLRRPRTTSASPPPATTTASGYTEIAVFFPSSASWAIWNPVTGGQRWLVAGAPNLHDVPLGTPSATVASLGLVPHVDRPRRE